MFAVPGWSISAASLKKQTSSSLPPDPSANERNGALKSNKKRKRGSGKSKTSQVNAENVVELYETVIEGRNERESKSEEDNQRRQKISVEEKEIRGDGHAAQLDEGSKTEGKRRKINDKKREKKAAVSRGSNDLSTKDVSIASVLSTKPDPQASAAPRPLPTLTPLQAKMREKLVSARFRHLNQMLYTTPSSHSLELFKENPGTFAEYHEGFRRQVEVWPENPVNSFIFDVKIRAKARGGVQRSDSEEAPLPRTNKICRIADLGCGDAALSAALQRDSKKANLEIYSFDLHSPSPLVTRADIANLPLEDGSVDVAIFCLALMGTNWVDFIEEAFRVLRWKGELWVAEIKSRFGRVAGNRGSRVDHSVGNRQKKDRKKVEEEDTAHDDAALMVEVDENYDTKQETDVSAFVEVLRKRGFALKGDKAVDLRNRMFVKMHFVKCIAPIRGKCVPAAKGPEKLGLETWKKPPKVKFMDKEDNITVATEAEVLKPCVYKLR